MPWTMNVVEASIRMLKGSPPRGIRPRDLMGMAFVRPALLDRPPRGLVQRHAAIRVRHPVALEDLEALLLPRARDPEDRDLLRRVEAELHARLDNAARDDVHARVGDDRHHHRDLVDA